MPPTATAITGNLTVTQQSAAGYLGGDQGPDRDPATSTLNFPVSDNRANGVFAPLEDLGRLSIVYRATAGAHTQVILDVTGYFEPGTAGLRFVPLNPGRIMDTRSGAVLSGKTGVFHAGAARALEGGRSLGRAGRCPGVHGQPDRDRPDRRRLHRGVARPATAVPATSTLNFPLGDNRANGLVSPLGTGPAWARRGRVHRRRRARRPSSSSTCRATSNKASLAGEARPAVPCRHAAGRRASAGTRWALGSMTEAIPSPNGRVYLVSAARTPIGKFGGALNTPAVELGGAPSGRPSSAPASTRDAPIDEVLMGQVLQAGAGQAPARQAAFEPGCPTRRRRRRSTASAARASRRSCWRRRRSGRAMPRSRSRAAWNNEPGAVSPAGRRFG